MKMVNGSGDSEIAGYNAKIDELREAEYPMLTGATYLDHAGTTLYPKSLIDEFSKDMLANLLGNPHSASLSSQLSSRRIENVRLRVLRLLNAEPEHFDVIFVANATAGIKMVMEAFRDHENGFWYGYHRDAHTSLVGVREAAVERWCFESDQEVEEYLTGEHDKQGTGKTTRLGLLAYPAQSNMNGRRLPLAWSTRLRSSRSAEHQDMYTLLDAAALLSTSPLDFGDHSKAPDFTVLSFYKIFGFPDLGALIVRKESGHLLRSRKYFGGGTVEMVSCVKEQWHVRKEESLHERMEDGTLPIHSIIALDNALSVHARMFDSLQRIASHTSSLAKRLYDGLRAMRHSNGNTVCEIYKDPCSSYEDALTQGPVIAFNLRNSQGAWVSNTEVEKLAAIRNIHLRSGGLCNPGGIASSLGLAPWEMKRNLSAGQRCGSENDVMGGKPTGVVRVSLGAMSNMQDVTTFLEFMDEFFVEHRTMEQRESEASLLHPEFYVESLTIYPIKSCGGWSIPPDKSWEVKPEGLAWDREWCLVHQGTRAALSQKRYPRMALIRPSIDLDNDLLRVRYYGQTQPSAPAEITPAPSPDSHPATSVNRPDIPKRTSNPTKPASAATHHTTDPTPDPLPPTTTRTPLAPILLSNESPILTISRSSLNRLNEQIKLSAGKACSADVFRANIILAEDPRSPPGIEQPYIEDSWRYLRVGPHTYFQMLGACRRCQMVCVDQTTGERNQEPFVTLAKTRRFEGGVFFGVHACLLGSGGRGRGG
ncbi:MAG: PLP-dependent transferase [Lasallia pustulata]|uniref:Molybdenum cofactor sulfurase n=1 Tax=Lasallia pustulata TaxID=136370 RepID=A0A5M8PEL4_9LECA|nr:MAG: PLP-dependent transferase [Lasallia pustulata]